MTILIIHVERWDFTEFVCYKSNRIRNKCLSWCALISRLISIALSSYCLEKAFPDEHAFSPFFPFLPLISLMYYIDFAFTSLPKLLQLWFNHLYLLTQALWFGAKFRPNKTIKSQGNKSKFLKVGIYFDLYLSLFWVFKNFPLTCLFFQLLSLDL